MHRYQGKLNQSEMDALGHKSQLLDKKIDRTKNFLKTSGVAGLRGMRAYISIFLNFI